MHASVAVLEAESLAVGMATVVQHGAASGDSGPKVIRGRKVKRDFDCLACFFTAATNKFPLRVVINERHRFDTAILTEIRKRC